MKIEDVKISVNRRYDVDKEQIYYYKIETIVEDIYYSQKGFPTELEAWKSAFQKSYQIMKARSEFEKTINDDEKDDLDL